MEYNTLPKEMYIYIYIYIYLLFLITVIVINYVILQTLMHLDSAEIVSSNSTGAWIFVCCEC